jgi:hypothetical protein
MADQQTVISRIIGFLRQSGGGIAVEALINFVLPYVIYDQAKPHLGEVNALIASSGPPIAWSLIEFARKRKVDFISMFVLLGIALSLLAMLGGGSVKFLQLRERMVTAAIGLAFVISVVVRRPLIYEFARASMRRNKSAELDDFESRRDDPGFRHAMNVMTLVWGCGLMAEASVAALLVWNLTVKQYLIAGPILGYSVSGLLVAWTFLYVRKARARGEARRAAARANAPMPAEPAAPVAVESQPSAP